MVYNTTLNKHSERDHERNQVDPTQNTTELPTNKDLINAVPKNLI